MFKKPSNALPADPVPGGSMPTADAEHLQTQIDALKSAQQTAQRAAYDRLAKRVHDPEPGLRHKFGSLNASGCRYCGTNRSKDWHGSICDACYRDKGMFLTDEEYKNVIVHRIVSGNWRGFQRAIGPALSTENVRSGFLFFHETNSAPMLPRWMYFDHSIIRKNMEIQPLPTVQPLALPDRCLRCQVKNSLRHASKSVTVDMHGNPILDPRHLPELVVVGDVVIPNPSMDVRGIECTKCRYVQWAL